MLLRSESWAGLEELAHLGNNAADHPHRMLWAFEHETTGSLSPDNGASGCLALAKYRVTGPRRLNISRLGKQTDGKIYFVFAPHSWMWYVPTYPTRRTVQVPPKRTDS